MSAHMKARHTSDVANIVIEISKREKRIVFIPLNDMDEVEAFLKKRSAAEESRESSE